MTADHAFGVSGGAGDVGEAGVGCADHGRDAGVAKDVGGEVVPTANFCPVALCVGGRGGPEAGRWAKGFNPRFKRAGHSPWDDAHPVGFALYFKAIGVYDGLAGAEGCVKPSGLAFAHAWAHSGEKAAGYIGEPFGGVGFDVADEGGGLGRGENGGQ